MVEDIQIQFDLVCGRGHSGRYAHFIESPNEDAVFLVAPPPPGIASSGIRAVCAIEVLPRTIKSKQIRCALAGLSTINGPPPRPISFLSPQIPWTASTVNS